MGDGRGIGLGPSIDPIVPPPSRDDGAKGDSIRFTPMFEGNVNRIIRAEAGVGSARIGKDVDIDFEKIHRGHRESIK